jgi:hypothetical protein
MKKFTACLLPLFCLLLSSSAQAPKKQSDLESDNVKGKVKQITQKYYEAEEKEGRDTIGQQYESTDRNFVINYNEKGYITWATFYKTRSTLDYRYTFKYDNAGNRIEETWFDSDNALDYRITRKFSNMGHLLELKRYTDTTATYTEKYVYEPDPSGNPVKTSLYDENDVLITMTTSIYDGYGNRIEDDNFDGKGKSMGKVLYTYDSRRLKTSEDAYSADGNIMTKKKFQYEFRGKLSQQQNFDNNGKLVEKNVFVFNDKGDENEWTNFDRTGFVVYKYTYTYEYDAQGNWIKKTQLQDGKPVFYTLREIVYN